MDVSRLYISSLHMNIGKDALLNYRGFKKIDNESQASITRDRELDTSHLFFMGEDLSNVLKKHSYGNDAIVTAVIPGLRDQFLVNRSLLKNNEMKMFKECIARVMPSFNRVDIPESDRTSMDTRAVLSPIETRAVLDTTETRTVLSPIETRTVLDTTERNRIRTSSTRSLPGIPTTMTDLATSEEITWYQIIGDITPYDVIYFPLSLLIQKMRDREMISIQIDGIPQGINLYW